MSHQTQQATETPIDAASVLDAGLGAWIKCEDRMPPPGVPVIAFVPSYYGGGKSRRIRAQHAPPKTLEQSPECDGGEYDEETDTYYCEEGWYETNEYEEVHWAVTDEVTHWMPLPEAPNDRVEGRDAALSRRVPSHAGLCGNGAAEKVGAGGTAEMKS